MVKLIRRAWAAAPLAVIILALASVAAGVFAVRSAMFWYYWSDPAHRDQQIAAWMTPGYIAHSWYVPRDVVLDALGAPRGKDARPRNLRELSDLLGVPVEQLVAQAESAIADYRALNPPPPREPSEAGPQ